MSNTKKIATKDILFEHIIRFPDNEDLPDNFYEILDKSYEQMKEKLKKIQLDRLEYNAES